MNEFKFTVGVVFVMINSLILLSCFIGLISRIKSISESRNYKDLYLHFMVAFATLVFFFSNTFSFYTSYKYYIKTDYVLYQDIIVARMIDRAGIFMVSIIFILIGKTFPKNIIDNENIK